MFLTEKTKTDILHILVRTHLLVLTCQQSCMLLVIFDQICRKTQPLDLDHGLSERTGRCSNLVKNMVTRFFEGQTPENFCLKNSLLSRNSGTAERKRPGRGGVL